MPPPESRRGIRERAGLSQAALGSLLHVTGGAVCHWERDRCRPSGPRLLAYIELLTELDEEAARTEEGP
jgi:DNA-binding transcriptional regulator YiaG